MRGFRNRWNLPLNIHRTAVRLLCAAESAEANTDLVCSNAELERIGLIIQNPLSNTLKYHDKGPPQIHVSAVRHKGERIISIRDNGIGFDPQYGGESGLNRS